MSSMNPPSKLKKPPFQDDPPTPIWISYSYVTGARSVRLERPRLPDKVTAFVANGPESDSDPNCLFVKCVNKSYFSALQKALDTSKLLMRVEEVSDTNIDPHAPFVKATPPNDLSPDAGDNAVVVAKITHSLESLWRVALGMVHAMFDEFTWRNRMPTDSEASSSVGTPSGRCTPEHQPPPATAIERVLNIPKSEINSCLSKISYDCQLRKVKVTTTIADGARMVLSLLQPQVTAPVSPATPPQLGAQPPAMGTPTHVHTPPTAHAFPTNMQSATLVPVMMPGPHVVQHTMYVQPHAHAPQQQQTHHFVGGHGPQPQPQPMQAMPAPAQGVWSVQQGTQHPNTQHPQMFAALPAHTSYTTVVPGTPAGWAVPAQSQTPGSPIQYVFVGSAPLPGAPPAPPQNPPGMPGPYGGPSP